MVLPRKKSSADCMDAGEGGVTAAQITDASWSLCSGLHSVRVGAIIEKLKKADAWPSYFSRLRETILDSLEKQMPKDGADFWAKGRRYGQEINSAEEQYQHLQELVIIFKEYSKLCQQWMEPSIKELETIPAVYEAMTFLRQVYAICLKHCRSQVLRGNEDVVAAAIHETLRRFLSKDDYQKFAEQYGNYTVCTTLGHAVLRRKQEVREQRHQKSDPVEPVNSDTSLCGSSDSDGSDDLFVARLQC